MVIGRPQEFDSDCVMEAAMQLFWSQGYEATSLRDILLATGLSKSSLYQSFGNKFALFQRSLDSYREKIVRTMEESLAGAESGTAFIKALLLEASEETKNNDPRKGCFVMNTASEFAQTDPEIAKLVKSSTEAFRVVFEKAIRRAQVEGDISAHRDPKILSTYLLTNLSGLKTLAKGGADFDELTPVFNVIMKSLR